MIISTSVAVILTLLRAKMLENNLSAYIVPAEDEHYTEFVADCHQRRAYISNFTGSAGTAIVTNDSALLWTDGRYYFQAEQQLDLSLWTLMRDGMSGTPTQSQWLTSNLNIGDRVGVDPALYTKGTWDNMAGQLQAANLSLVDIDVNLVDEIWDSRPPCSSNPIFNLGLEFAGKNTSDKVRDVREKMQENGASVLLLAELDEVAWLLNLRGKDIPSSSTFFSFVVLTQTSLDFFVNIAQVPVEVRDILASNVPELEIKDYSTVYTEFPNIIGRNPNGTIWVNRNANYKLVKSVSTTSPDRLLVKLTPVSLMKAIKNSVEVEGYRKGLLRDSAALCEFFAWVEKAMDNGENVTETSAAEILYQIRQNRSSLFFDKSFATISATGRNAAIIHYMPTPESSRPLSKDELYLVDSGALYYDATTDITRCVSFGSPTAFQKEAYTRVLKGQIALTMAVFPEKTVGHRLDSFARQALWSAGLDYNHGTGHGVGSFLNIHEGPQGIGSGYRADDPGLQENMFTSNEPGYYDEVEGFGIRLENVIRVRKVELENNFQNQGFLGFEDLTFVPYQHKLIDFSLLSDDEVDYLNSYQNKTRELVGTYLTQNPNFPQDAYDWMIKETMPIVTIIPPEDSSSSPASSETSSSTDPSSSTENGNGANLNCIGVSLQILVAILIMKQFNISF